LFESLRPYQKDIIKQTIKSTKSTLIQIPTGAGKTIIAKEIIIDLINNHGKQILFVAPKIILMEQTAEVFKGLKPHIMHGNNAYDKKHNILISTIQTASRRDTNPDVIIIDEIHYGFDGKMIEKLIKDKPQTRIIGLSATPYDKTGRQLKGFDLILDKFDMKYMIKNKYLVPIESYVLTKLDLTGIRITAGDYDLKELGKIVCDNNTILEIVMTTKKYIIKSKKTIVFAVDIAHAELLTKAYKHEGFKAKVIHSKLNREEIKRELFLFKTGQTKILVSVLMLTTGFDVPDTDVAVIARPTKSQNLYKQMVGRIARTAENKKFATLLDCGNVIENLGLPLDKIKIIEKNENTNQQKCEKCGSENLKLKVSKNKSYWECNDCGNIKEIEQGSYECLYCKELYTSKGKFTVIKNKLYLNCKKCGYRTLISEFTGDEIFIKAESFLPFKEARNFIRRLNIKSKTAWKKYCQNNLKGHDSKPSNIPSEPAIFYQNKGWINTEDWLGIESKTIEIEVKEVKDEFLPFAEARKFVRTLKFFDRSQWDSYYLGQLKIAPIPKNIPIDPHVFYKDTGWIDYEDWFQEYLPFKEARAFARKLNLQNRNGWSQYCCSRKDKKLIKPQNIPRNPNVAYKNTGWINYKNWLTIETEKTEITYLSFEDAREYVRSLGILGNRRVWRDYWKKNSSKLKSIPYEPNKIYKNKGWVDYTDWFISKL